jgi:hypothetical protein
VAFLKFSRDKRGVEHFCLMHTTTNRRGKVRPRVLYWYRSPPDVKVGREPFDAPVRRALEAQHPDITFDWRAIIDTPIPSADADKWRERRRAERAAKHAAAAEESAEATGGDGEADEPPPAAVCADVSIEAAIVVMDAPDAPDASDESTTPASAGAVGAPDATSARGGEATRKRRRRRRSGGSGGRGGAQNGSPSSSSPSDTGSAGG